MAAPFVLACVSIISLLPFLGAYIVRLLLRTAGQRLRRRTSGKRALIFQRVKVDERQLRSNAARAPKHEDEDWERVESYAAGTAVNGDAYQEKDYEGVIGFLHPFWYG